ncbi:nucleotidyltransferase domain-containing protein [Streptomyces sp. bgisy091]|uniref:nucleotidyltransferase domain-containing protein n=1 Tax=Streptomyces sp. bgisy091 TaxID=3413778 RepID=UPI003D742C7C
MTTSAGPALDDALPGGLPPDAADEIRRVLGQLPAGVSCVATGSLIEGLGNPSSDIDLFVLPPEGTPAGNPVAIGIRQFRYVDCEYLAPAQVCLLADRFDETDARDPHTLTARDFVRYYRLATAARLRVDDVTAALLDRCSVTRHTELFTPWSLGRAAHFLARARVAAALGESRQRIALLREAALWRATAVLAGAGEPYPSLKWVTTKATRRFGTRSPEYDDCLRGYAVTPGDADTVERWLGEQVGPPREPAPAGWVPAPGTSLLVLDGLPHLVRGRRSLARLTGPAAPLVGALTEHGDWAGALEGTARAWRVEPADVTAATTTDLTALTDAGYLTRLDADAEEAPDAGA